MNGKQAKSLRAFFKTDGEQHFWFQGYSDVNIKEKPILDAWGKLIGTYTTSTKVLKPSGRTNYKHFKELHRNLKGHN